MSEEEGYRVGRFRLVRRPDREGWFIAWYDADAKQRRVRATGTRDFQQAVRAIHEHAFRHDVLRNADPDEVPLARVLLDYWHNHAEALPSATQAKIALAIWNEHFDGASVSAITPDRQTEFVRALRAKGHSDGYISRTLSVGRAAVRMAWQNGAIKSAPFIKDVETQAARRSKDPKGRPMTIAEVGRFIDAIKSAHLLKFTVLAINTLSRPDALLDLGRAQCDFDAGIIDLNPAGRRQTKKFRPIVPMTRTVRPWLMLPPEKPGSRNRVVKLTDRLITYRCRPVASIKTAWRETREAAGFDDRVNPYSIRHTLARHLRSQRVPPEEIDIMLGHCPPDNKTSLIYAPYSPDYCRNAAEAIDDFCAKLQQHTARSITGPVSLENMA